MPKTDLLQGTLDLLILKILTLGPNHGWGIANRIRQISREALNASQGSLYPALHRLELRGDVESEMTASENTIGSRSAHEQILRRATNDSSDCGSACVSVAERKAGRPHAWGAPAHSRV